MTPTKGSEQAAGFDLYSCQDKKIPANGHDCVQTGISIQLPQGTYGRISIRSSLAKQFLQVGGGVIDSDYRGELIIFLFNHSKNDFQVLKGSRVAQLIIEKISHPQLIELDKLPKTERNDKGFGSSGL